MQDALPSRLGLNPVSREVGKAAVEWFYPFRDNNHDLTTEFTKDVEIVLGASNHAILCISDSHMAQYWPRIKWDLDRLERHARSFILITAGASPALPNVNLVVPGKAG